MKKVSIILSVILLGLFAFTISIDAQEVNAGEKNFIGKWNLMVYGLPDGDTKMVMNIEKKEEKLSGTLTSTTSTDPPLELTNLVVADSTLNASFSAQGMDITLLFKLKDAKNVSGSMMDMFDIKGTKEEPQQ
jgi:hypothetical protein